MHHAAGRIAAELATPYPPGVPLIAPRELLDAAALDYTSGVAAGMAVPDTDTGAGVHSL